MFDETFKASGDPRLRDAARHFHEGYRLQMTGVLDPAVEEYRHSLESYPTAEAHTFLGWALSLKGDLEGAIQECERAIELDPDFGNPYNDIGAYLMSQHKPQQAKPWFEKAKRAKRYDARHYPCFNLGRVYELMGEWSAAEAEFIEALSFYPHYDSARESLKRVRSLLLRRN
ncbi:MAG: tetratricopeptide repeat protein [Bacteroidetes bacterium]|nr:tetratricopeptide repeat protein [Bacteroidota bacterium]